MAIHPTAIIEDGAQIDATATVGPYCVIGSLVELGANVVLHAHVVLAGRTSIGEGTEIFSFASIGQIPQDLKFSGEESSLVIGKNNRIREYVTINPGTKGGCMVTRVGDNCLIMASAHIAHDCQVGNSVIMANNATLAGHVEVGDFAFIGGLSAVHQFVRIGQHAMVGGMSGVENDVIPYGLVKGERARLSGLNLVGLKRRGFPREEIQRLQNTYDDLFVQEGTLLGRIEQSRREDGQSALSREVLDFVRKKSSRALCQPN